MRMVDDLGSRLNMNSDGRIVYLQVIEKDKVYSEYFRLNKLQALQLANYIYNTYGNREYRGATRDDKPVFGTMFTV